VCPPPWSVPNHIAPDKLENGNMRPTDAPANMEILETPLPPDKASEPEPYGAVKMRTPSSADANEAEARVLSALRQYVSWPDGCTGDQTDLRATCAEPSSAGATTRPDGSLLLVQQCRAAASFEFRVNADN
jgi:hypothetical protein